MLNNTKALDTFFVNEPDFINISITKPEILSQLPVKKMETIQVSAETKLDGRLTKPFWKKAHHVKYFQRMTDDGTIDDSLKNNKMQVKVTCSGTYIYIGLIWKRQNIGEGVRYTSVHDGPVFLNNYFGVYITPQKIPYEKYFYDGYYYFIAVNPAGGVFDAFYNKWHNGVFYPVWNPDIEIKSKVSANIWKMEMAVPLDEIEYYSPKGRDYLLSFVCKNFIGNKDILYYSPENIEVKKSFESMYKQKMSFYDSRNIPLSEYLPEDAKLIPELKVRQAVYNKNNKIEWDRAVMINNLFLHDTGKLPSQKTKVRITFDNQNLYVLFICRESLMDELETKAVEPNWPGWDEWGSYTTTEKYNVYDDAVGMYLQPNYIEYDQYHIGYYLIMVNAEGVPYIGYFDEYGIFYKIRPDIKSEIKKYQNSWTAKIKIPFEILEIDPENSSLWGLNLFRRRPSKSDSDAIHIKSYEKHDRASFFKTEYEGGYEISCWSPTYGHLRNPARMGIIEGIKFNKSRQLKSYVESKINHIENIIISLDKNKKYINDLYNSLDKLKNKMKAATVQKSLYKNFKNLKMRSKSLKHWYKGKKIQQIDEEDRRLTDVFFINQNTGWAVGAAGIILYTCNGGETWDIQKSGTDYELESVHFVDELNGWVVGGNIRAPRMKHFIDRDIGAMGIILHTNDGGNTWTPQLMGDARWFYDVFFIDTRCGWAAGEYGLIMATNDGGETWKIQMSGSLKWLHKIHFINRNNGWIACEDEEVLITSDGGINWNKVKTPLHQDTHDWAGSLYAVWFADEFTGWTAGRNGNLFKTTDGGETWLTEKIPVNKKIKELVDFKDVQFINKKIGWAVSSLGGIVFYTKNGGETWKTAHTNNLNWLHALCFTDSRNGWAVGERGTILNTEDGGKTWNKQKTAGDTLDILVIHAHSDDELPMGYITAYYADKGYKTGYIRASRDDHSTYAMGELREQEYRKSCSFLGGILNNTVLQGQNGGESGYAYPFYYAMCHGLEPLEREIASYIRALKPKIIITQELAYDKTSHSVTGTCTVNAVRKAGDPEKLKELENIGLKAWKTQKLYITVNKRAVERVYTPWPPTLDLRDILKKKSPRLGCIYGDVASIAFLYHQSQDGYKGIKKSMERSSWRRAVQLHLLGTCIEGLENEKDIFDGIK